MGISHTSGRTGTSSNTCRYLILSLFSYIMYCNGFYLYLQVCAPRDTEAKVSCFLAGINHVEGTSKGICKGKGKPRSCILDAS